MTPPRVDPDRECGKRFGKRREYVCRRVYGHKGRHGRRPSVRAIERRLKK